MNKQQRSILILFITAIIWGLAFVAQLLGASHVGAFTFNGTRFLLGSLSLIPVILIFERGAKDGKMLKRTLLIGACEGAILFTASTLQQYAIGFTGSAGKSGFITGLYTVIVPVIGIFLKKRTGLNVWAGAVLAVIGLYFVSFSAGFSAIGIGDVLLLISAVVWAFQILVIDEFGNRVYSLRFAFTEFFTCALLSMVCAFIFEDVSFAAVMEAKYPILYTGIMSVGVAYTCQIIGQRHADPTAAAIVMSTESIFSALGEAFVLGVVLHSSAFRPLSASQYAGCAIMFCGIVISQLHFGKKA